MSTDLVLATTPRNMRYVRGHVEGDVFRICERLEEIDKSLFVYPLDPPVKAGDRTCHYSIVEECADGVPRLVFRATALDARILEHVQYLMNVPFEKRFAEAEARADKLEAEARENEKDELYETMGRPMLTDLERCGFIQRRTSYAKRGVTGGRGSRRG